MSAFVIICGLLAGGHHGVAVTGNGLLGERHEEMLALFRSLDPRLRRIVMSRSVEILEVTNDIRGAMQVLTSS